MQLYRLLIAEAEKAAKALEVAATKSPIAQASLIETRNLIAEAIQSLESIETQHTTETNVSSSVSLSVIDQAKSAAALEVLNQSDKSQVNGHKALTSSDYKSSDDFGKFSLLNELHLSTSNDIASSAFDFEKESGSTNQPSETQQDQRTEYETDPSPTVVEIQTLKDETPSKPLTVTKKWVRGRLVEVEETQ